jgi:hypothetical protein
VAPESFDFPNVNLSVGEQFDFFAEALAVGDLLDVSLTVTFPETAVPEPGSIAVLVTGLLALIALQKRRRRRIALC